MAVISIYVVFLSTSTRGMVPCFLPLLFTFAEHNNSGRYWLYDDSVRLVVPWREQKQW